MNKKVTLKHVGFFCDGQALLNLWGGGQGTIEMDSWKTKTDTKEEIVKNINDGQMGCESIEQAEVNIYDLYENGYKEFNRTEIFESKEISMNNPKLGV